MHVSLDSALGRQRRLNSVGESVLQIAPSAAAAYSLRSLTGGDPKVVRVRRGSDNHEQDFTASGVSSGALTSFVNAQVTPPLDIQELSATGRDGDFLIAKAAYSLRSLGTRQATLAATGDTVARADGKFVAQVRRSSDDAVKSFTADEVTDGTLLAFVNEDVTIYQSDYSAGIDGFNATSTTTATGNQDGVSDSAGTSKDNVLKVVKAADSQAYLQRDQGVVAGLTYTVSGSFFAPASNTGVDGILIKDGLSGTSLSNFPSGYLVSDGTWTDFSFSYTATANGNQRVQLGISSLGSNPTNSSTGSTGDIVYIADLKFVETTSNGFVKTWYDQSVTNQAGDTATGNHAVQATAANQPKIVNAGALLTAGVTFDGGDSLSVSGDPVITASSSGTYSAFSVQTVATTSEAGYLYGNASSSNGSSLYAAASAFTLTNKNVATLDNLSRSSGQNLLSAVYNNGDAGLLVNGAGTMTDTGTYDFSAGSSDFIIGNRNGGTSAGTFLNGSINEIVIYNSNQTDNRTAIEANIGEAYSLDLPSGVDPGFDQVDGFVETWYDQSGNSNDAVQLTAAEQPKIVSAGALLADGLTFDGSDDSMTTTSAISSTNIAIACVSKSANNATAGIFSMLDGFNDGHEALYLAGEIRIASNSSDLDVSITTTNQNLYFANYDGSTQSLSSNGGTPSTKSTSQTISVSAVAQIGSRSGGNKLNGSIEELIVYASDQSANRAALETNILSHYGIS